MYLEDSLKNGFGFKEQEGDYEVASLLGQLKILNQWLEDTTGYKFEVDETLERLKKKLYAFLLEHENRKRIMKSHLSLGNLKGSSSSVSIVPESSSSLVSSREKEGKQRESGSDGTLLGGSMKHLGARSMFRHHPYASTAARTHPTYISGPYTSALDRDKRNAISKVWFRNYSYDHMESWNFKSNLHSSG
ncbi:hypothetical protein Scep_014578 [Stephania cephalantha]|uniref:DUF6857 domain-containing protein n=1 Tax=Stephania cephalantha TaxID=152367 RepID=A0AAP0J3L0_9MAGN